MVYIHVPFCKQLCYYCDFHFSLSLRFKNQMVDAILKEFDQRKDYLRNKQTKTIYFGGGTPSVLSLNDLDRILQKVHTYYTVAPDAEITLEANPDDLTPEYLQGLKALGINRLSIGIQSFKDEELKQMNRRHTAAEAFRAIENALAANLDNITADLIYGLPNSNLETWSYSLERALSLPIQHFSCYHLGIEEKTAFANFKKKGTIAEVSEDNSWQQYELLCKRMREQGYEHYEISNFALEGWQSKHNSAYWNGTPYIGVGPSAHSYDGVNRQWNMAHNRQYMEAISRGTSFFEEEELNDKERFNDYLLTALRTSNGFDLKVLDHDFSAFRSSFEAVFRKYINSDLLFAENGFVALTEKGMFRSDAIIADFFVV